VAAELKFVGRFLQKRMIEWYGFFPESDVLGSNAIMIALEQIRSSNLYVPLSLGNFAPSATCVLLHADRSKYFISRMLRTTHVGTRFEEDRKLISAQ
jgi:hypothetical protein